jgi:hypothetical protein
VSLDLTAIRLDIAAVLATIPGFTVVDAYENRNRDLAEMPFVQVWRDAINQETTQPELGMWNWTITWRLRAWLPLGDDATSQDLADSLSVSMREAFDTRPGLISNTTFSAEMTEIVADGFPDSEIPFLLVEGTLVTEAKAPAP